MDAAAPVRVVLILLCFALTAAGILDRIGNVNGTESGGPVNGTSILPQMESSGIELPTPGTKTDVPQGNFRVLNKEEDLPAENKDQVQALNGHFQTELHLHPFYGYLVRDHGGELKFSLVLYDQKTMSTSYIHPDMIKVEFLGTRRYMDIEFTLGKHGYFIGCYEQGSDMKYNGTNFRCERYVKRFDLTIPAKGSGTITGSRTLSTELSYADVPAISIAGSKEVVHVRITLKAQGSVRFTALFEAGKIAVIVPKSNAALIGGSVGGVLGVLVVIVGGVVIYKLVKRNKNKKLQKAAAAVVDMAEGDAAVNLDKSKQKSQSMKPKDRPAEPVLKHVDGEKDSHQEDKKAVGEEVDVGTVDSEKKKAQIKRSKKAAAARNRSRSSRRPCSVKAPSNNNKKERSGKESAARKRRSGRSKDASQSAVDESQDTPRDHVKMLNQVLLSKLRSKPAAAMTPTSPSVFEELLEE